MGSVNLSTAASNSQPSTHHLLTDNVVSIDWETGTNLAPLARIFLVAFASRSNAAAYAVSGRRHSGLGTVLLFVCMRRFWPRLDHLDARNAHIPPIWKPTRVRLTQSCVKGSKSVFISSFHLWAPCGQVVGTEWALNGQTGQKTPRMSRERAVES